MNSRQCRLQTSSLIANTPCVVQFLPYTPHLKFKHRQLNQPKLLSLFFCLAGLATYQILTRLKSDLSTFDSYMAEARSVKPKWLQPQTHAAEAGGHSERWQAVAATRRGCVTAIRNSSPLQRPHLKNPCSTEKCRSARWKTISSHKRHALVNF